MPNIDKICYAKFRGVTNVPCSNCVGYYHSEMKEICVCVRVRARARVCVCV
jgi:hypothetical protein